MTFLDDKFETMESLVALSKYERANRRTEKAIADKKADADSIRQYEIETGEPF